MNRIRKSMERIHASDELKKNTLKYIEAQRKKQFSRKHYHIPRYVLAVACLCIFFAAGGYGVYRRPVSYISMDVNPSVEMGINRFGRVISADGYNEDGKDILEHISVKNLPYMGAIDCILKDETYHDFLTEDSQLVFTIISDDSDEIVEEIRANSACKMYDALIYTSDEHCREQAHRHEMSFGKYRAYQELAEYDQNITVEDCHRMTMWEIQDSINRCRNHEQSGGRWRQEQSGHHRGGHGGHHGY